MRYRKLGNTGLLASEIGLGAEWLERHNAEEVKAVIDCCEENGINILDCWMAEPNVRTNIGAAIKGRRDKWIIEGHIGSTWQNGQYVRTRELIKVKEAFSDLLSRLGTDYIDLGMIHYVDKEEEFEKIYAGEFMEYVRELKKDGTIRHIGLSTHNPAVAKRAALSGEIEVLLFSVNPAFDLLPDNEDITKYFEESTYADASGGISPEREELYRICEQRGVAINVMKGYAGGRLFDEKRSPFGVALTPVQCLHYALTRPAVASVMAGCDTCHGGRGLRDGFRRGEGLRQRPGRRAAPCVLRPVYLLRPLCAVPGRHRYCHGKQALSPGCDAGGSAGIGGGPLPCAFCHGRRLHRLRRLRDEMSVLCAGR